VIVHKSVLVVV